MFDTEQSRIMTSALFAMLNKIPEMVFVKNTDLIYMGASQSFAELVGKKSPEELIGKTDFELFSDPDLATRYVEDDRRLLESRESLIGYIEPTQGPGGERRYCQTSKHLFFDGGKVVGLYGLTRDITREYEAKLNYERELQALLTLPSDALGAVLFDVTNWRIVDTRTKDSCRQMFAKYSSIEELLQNAADCVAEDEQARGFYETFTPASLHALFQEGTRRTSREYLRKTQDGNTLWVHEDLYLLNDPLNGTFCAMLILLDIDSRKRAELALLQAAERDALTGLYNRKTTMEHISRFLQEEGASSCHLLFMIDVDNFKLINDTFGHQAGDEVLISISASIRQLFRDTDIVGRVGGDEFFALMKFADNPQIAINRAQSLVEALQFVFTDHGIKVELSGSVGISRYSNGDKTLETLYAEADAALYRAKQAGKNRFAFARSTSNEFSDHTTENQASSMAVHLQTLLENMDGIMFQTELDDNNEVRIVYSSQAPLAAAPYESCAIGTSIWESVVPEDLPPLKKAICDASLSCSVLDHIYRVNNSHGQTEWRHVRGTPLPDRGDGIPRMIHVSNDITAQKQTEESLREKDRIIDFAMRNTDVNLWFLDLATGDCVLSENCQRVHELPGVEVLHHFPDSLLDTGFFRPDCMEPVRNAYRELREKGTDFSLDTWVRRLDGSGWWCERIILSAMAGEDGKARHAVGIGRDMTAEKQMEEKYEAFQTYRRLAEKNTMISLRLNLTTNWCGDCVTDNPVVQKMYIPDTVDGFFDDSALHIPTEEEVARGRSIFSREHLLRAFSKGQTSVSAEYRYRIQAGRLLWLRTTVDMMKNPSTGDVEALLYSFDVDYEKNMQFVVDKLLSTDYEFLGLIDATTGYLMVFGAGEDTDGIARNGSFYDTEMPRVFRELILDEYYEEGVRTMERGYVIHELENGEPYVCSFPVRNCGRVNAGRKQWKFIYLDDSKTQILLTRSDITDVFTAERDALTGLYNRQAFYRHVREVLDDNRSQKFVLVRYDIDRFKAYNDMYGTQAGDKLLAVLGRAIRQNHWPELSVFGRIEADHFCALLPVSEFDAETWGETHLKWLGGITQNYRLTSSVGVYEITSHEVDVSLMCDRALLALRTVKDNYASKVAWYDEGLRKQLVKEQALVEEMEQALWEEQFILYFQPQINYETGALVGAEALVRWQHPKRGLIFPDEFIPLFEKNGFILKLDTYVWERSCRYLRRWLDMIGTITPFSVSVNISRYDIYDTELCRKLMALVEKYQIPPALLKLEITESAYMENPEQLLDTVRELQKLGFIVEMDDFGAGYSSLNTLKDVPVDILKLDVRFLSHGEDDERGGLILSSVVRMARWLKLPVIAEGVEDAAQAEYLKSLSCFFMQGYHFGKPMPAEDFEALLLRSKTDSIRQEHSFDLSGSADLWDPQAQSSLVFNYLAGGAAILEFDGTTAEILRANDKFYQELQTTREDYLDKQRHTLSRFDEAARAVYLAMLEEAVRTGREAECEVQSLPHEPGAPAFWTHNRVRLLAKNRKHSLLYLTVENLTGRGSRNEKSTSAPEEHTDNL